MYNYTPPKYLKNAYLMLLVFVKVINHTVIFVNKIKFIALEWNIWLHFLGNSTKRGGNGVMASDSNFHNTLFLQK